MEERRTLIYIGPSVEICKLYSDIYKKLSINYQNKYMDHAMWDWKPHLMIYYATLPPLNNSKILHEVEILASKTPQFNVTLSVIGKTAGKFVMVWLEDSSANKLVALNEELVERMSNLRENGIKEKYLINWNTFTFEEQQRMKRTGMPYVYKPHISLAKLLPEDLDPSINKLDINCFSGLSFTTTEILVAQDDLDPTHDWPIIGKFPLSLKHD